ncbi:MAG: segregation and condensation protein A [Chloroflexota bacterium]
MIAAAAEMPDLSGYQLRLPAFEGPLDVLLRLIEREHLAITEISLMSVTDQFLAHVERLGEAPPETIAAFSSVAGRLLVLKSRSLLPRPPVEEETIDEDDLVRQLIEYRAMKDAARRFAETQAQGLGAYPRGSVSGPGPVAVRLANHQPAALARSLRRRRSVLAMPVMPAPVRSIVTIQSMLRRLIDALSAREPVRFRMLVGPEASREEVMVGFLAVLVLLRRRAADAEQPEPFGEITIFPLDEVIDPMSLAGADLG